MAPHNKLLFSIALLTLLSSCASVGGGQNGSAEPQYEGIRTRPISAAPATQAPNNTSRPLSQQNTPAAMAAREVARRPAAAPAPANSANPDLAAFLAAAASAPASTQSKTLQKGSKVQLRSGTLLYARPSKASQTAAIAQDVELELGPQMYNADGYWWYVTAGKESGWLLQTDIPR